MDKSGGELKAMGIEGWAAACVRQARQDVAAAWEKVAAVRQVNQRRVLAAFRGEHISEHHLAGTTGYGYHDPSRAAIEALYARLFGAEAALVRPQIVSGTHAISSCLLGICRPGDEIVSATGAPYDTLRRVICGPGRSLADWGIGYRQVELTADGGCDTAALVAALTPRTRLVMFQRSRGYSLRPSLAAAAIGQAAAACKKAAPHIVTFVDNCYGEFVEEQEPSAYAGVDLLAGSLIKNPGGTLAPAGGYIVGRAELVARAADAVTAPGLGAHVGPMLGLGRPLLQGLYLAPLLVAEAVCGAILAARVFSALGFATLPGWDEPRADAVQAVVLGRATAVEAVCRAVQASSPVDNTAVPIPAELPGYADPIIMAAGTFVQGASSELSADAPMRPPYAVYLQGGMAREQMEVALEAALVNLVAAGCLPAISCR